MITLTGVFFWSFMKVVPNHVVVRTFEKVLMMRPWNDSLEERVPLNAEKKV